MLSKLGDICRQQGAENPSQPLVPLWLCFHVFSKKALTLQLKRTPGTRDYPPSASFYPFELSTERTQAQVLLMQGHSAFFFKKKKQLLFKKRKYKHTIS